jgi:hypothetical protein
MSKLFVGNATKQKYEFAYRVPEQTGLRVQPVPIGQQVQVTGDLSTVEIDAILEQHRVYGIVNVADINRSKAFAGICYSIDKPISVSKLMEAIDHNTQALVERGREMRKELAIANNEMLEGALSEAGRPERLRNFEMSVVEENHDERDETDPIAEGVRVQRQEGDHAPERAPRSRKRGH